jgi:hypothetical protein
VEFVVEYEVLAQTGENATVSVDAIAAQLVRARNDPNTLAALATEMTTALAEVAPSAAASLVVGSVDVTLDEPTAAPVEYPDPVKAAPLRGVFAASFGWGGAGIMLLCLLACLLNRQRENKAFKKKNNRPRTEAELMNMTEYQAAAAQKLKATKQSVRDGLKAWSNMLAGGEDKDDSDDDSSLEGGVMDAPLMLAETPTGGGGPVLSPSMGGTKESEEFELEI